MKKSLFFILVAVAGLFVARSARDNRVLTPKTNIVEVTRLPRINPASMLPAATMTQ